MWMLVIVSAGIRGRQIWLCQKRQGLGESFYIVASVQDHSWSAILFLIDFSFKDHDQGRNRPRISPVQTIQSYTSPAYFSRSQRLEMLHILHAFGDGNLQHLANSSLLAFLYIPEMHGDQLRRVEARAKEILFSSLLVTRRGEKAGQAGYYRSTADFQNICVIIGTSLHLAVSFFICTSEQVELYSFRISLSQELHCTVPCSSVW